MMVPQCRRRAARRQGDVVTERVALARRHPPRPRSVTLQEPRHTFASVLIVRDSADVMAHLGHTTRGFYPLS